jgi:hypothetical protein
VFCPKWRNRFVGHSNIETGDHAGSSTQRLFSWDVFKKLPGLKNPIQFLNTVETA